MALIRHRKRARDHWLLLEPGADGALPPVPDSGDLIVPLVLWRSAREVLLAREGRLGVWLSGNEEPGELAADFVHFDVIAVDFPKFTNGRGYSLARLLRERHGWRGELRAVGDVQRDQLAYLARCGFDAFELRVADDPEAALSAFDDFSESYQSAADTPLPLFRRRQPAAQAG